ncbi:MAG: lysozyme [Pseudomonadota bacterium]
MGMTMRIGQNGLALIKDFEGLELEAYQDIVGVWTIGYGHTDHAGPPEVTPGLTITEEEAEDILRNDLGQYENAVTKAVKVDITQNMFDALVSITYNIGVNGMKGSTFIKRLNQKNYVGCAEAMQWWNKAGGQVVSGLKRRREAEADLFLQGYSDDALTEAEASQVRGNAVEEATPRRNNLSESRTVQGSTVAGGAGVAAAGAAILDTDESGSSSDTATTPDTTTPPETADPEAPETSDDPFENIDLTELEDATPQELAEKAREIGVELKELRDAVEAGEAETVPAFLSAIRAENISEAVIIVAGVIAVLAAIFVIMARIDDWNNHKR